MAGSVPKSISAFIASPGDLSPERKVFKEVVDELNRGFADGANVSFTAKGWEELNSEAGRRVQDVINRVWQDCDIFILVLSRRWGRKAKGSSYSSYTEEEFREAFAAWKKTGKPEIMVFFKSIDAEAERDPGIQLKKVLRFRRELEEAGDILIRSFPDTAAFQKDVDKHLRAFARGEWSKLPPPAAMTLPQEIVEKVLDQAPAPQEPGALPAAGDPAQPKKLQPDLSLVANYETEMALARSAIAAAQEGKTQRARLLFAKAIAGTTDLSILDAAEAFYAADNDPANAASVRERAVAIYENRLSACQRYMELMPMGITDELQEAVLGQMLGQLDPDLAEVIRGLCREVFGEGKLERLIVELMVNYYSDEEIRDMTTFIASPAGQASVTKQPLVLRQAMAVGQQRMEELIAQYQQQEAEGQGAGKELSAAADQPMLSQPSA